MSAFTLEDLNRAAEKIRALPPVAVGLTMCASTCSKFTMLKTSDVVGMAGVPVDINESVLFGYCNVDMSDGSSRVVQVSEFSE